MEKIHLAVARGEPAPFWTPEWPQDKPIIDAIAPEGDFNAVTGALGSVGAPIFLRVA